MKKQTAKISLECSHLESGACGRCKSPFARHTPDQTVTTRRASIRNTTKLAGKTDPILKMFMKANHAERIKWPYFVRGRRIGPDNLLYTASA